MDRRERMDDPVEALRAALDGKQAEIWTTLPGIIESFDPDAVTCSVQLAVKGVVQDEGGQSQAVNLPLLVDVPVVFPSGGGFTLTFPIKKGDECKVDFACRCIDSWWQSGNVSGTPDERMHDLSDGLATVGIRSQVRVLSPAVNTEGVQLRTDDGEAHITMLPDYTIRAQNPAAKAELLPTGIANIEANLLLNLKAPTVNIQANDFNMSGHSGGSSTFKMQGDINQTGKITSSGDHVAGGKSLMTHTHPGDSGGTTGAPN